MNFQQFLQMVLNNIVIILAVAFTVFGWIAKAVKEQKIKKAAQKAKEQRELEALRTGRMEEAPRYSATASASAAPTSAGAPQPSAQASLEEIAARRKAKMQAAQTRRPVTTPSGHASGQQTGQPTPAELAQQELGRVLGQILGVPTSKSPAPPPQPQSRNPGWQQRGPQNRQQPKRSPAPQRQRQAPTPPRQPQATRPPAARNASFDEGDVTHRTTTGSRITDGIKAAPAFNPNAPKHNPNAPVHDPNAPAFSYNDPNKKSQRAKRTASARNATLAGTDLRRLFILREIFEKPVAFRDQ
jgi:hypothetical protein